VRSEWALDVSVAIERGDPLVLGAQEVRDGFQLCCV
jgi:hypothetical protein